MRCVTYGKSGFLHHVLCPKKGKLCLFGFGVCAQTVTIATRIDYRSKSMRMARALLFNFPFRDLQSVPCCLSQAFTFRSHLQRS